MKKSRFFYPLVLLINDFFVTILAFALAFIIRAHYSDRPYTGDIHPSTYLTILFIAVPVWLIFFASLGLYNQSVYKRKNREWSRLLLGTIYGSLFMIGIDFFLSHKLFPARLIAVYGFILAFGLLLLSRIILRYIRSLLFRFNVGVSNVLIIGSTKTTNYIIKAVRETNTTGQQIVGLVGNLKRPPQGAKRFNNVEQALAALDKLNVDVIIQTELYDDANTNSAIISAAQSKHIQYKFVPANDEFLTANNQIELIGEMPVVAIHQTKLLSWGNVLKRIFDIVFSSIGLIITSPIMLVCMIILKLSAWRAPVLFKHKRVTRYGKEKTIYKLRTFKPEFSGKATVASFKKLGRDDLIKQYENGVTQFDNDPRVGKFGDFLRHSSLDELPQLWNVLKGDISLVGPRAIIKSELADYEKIAPLRQTIRSGITGLAQVAGRSDLPMEQRIELDIYYVQNWSIWLDIVILFRTFAAVFKRQGVK